MKNENKLKSYEITCTVNGTYEIEESAQHFYYAIEEAEEEFQNERPTDMYSLEHDEWEKKEFELEYTITAYVKGTFQAEVSANSEDEAMELAEEEYDNASFGDLDNIYHDSFEIEDNENGTYTISCVVNGTYEQSIVSSSLDDALSDAEDSFNRASLDDFGDLQDAEADDFEADNVNYTCICNVSALHTEKIYGYCEDDVIKQFEDFAKNGADYDTFYGEFTPDENIIENISIDDERECNSLEILQYIAENVESLMFARGDYKEVNTYTMPFIDSQVVDFPTSDDRKAVLNNLKKAVSTSEGRKEITNYLLSALVNTDREENEDLVFKLNNCFMALGEYNEFGYKDFIPYGIDEELDKKIDSADFSERIAAAKQGYGLDMLVNDPIVDVREAVARYGVFHDIMVNDDEYVVRAAIAEQGNYLDVLINDESDAVRVAVAGQEYGLDKLINDKSADVREVVASKGFGLDKLMYDRDVNVRAEVAYQGYGLDTLGKDVSQTVRDAVKQYREIALKNMNEACIAIPQISFQTNETDLNKAFDDCCSLYKSEGINTDNLRASGITNNNFLVADGYVYMKTNANSAKEALDEYLVKCIKIGIYNQPCTCTLRDKNFNVIDKFPSVVGQPQKNKPVVERD